MKRIFLLLFLAVFVFAVPAFGADVVESTAAWQQEGHSGIWYKEITITDTDGDGSSGTVTLGTNIDLIGAWIYSIKTVPGGTAPDVGADITLSDSDSWDVFNGQVVDFDTTAAQVKEATQPYSTLTEDLTIAMTSNTEAAAVVTVKIKVLQNTIIK